MKRFFGDYLKIFALLCVMGALYIVGNFVSSGFMSSSHAWSVLRKASFVGAAAVGQTLVVLTGGIDLSVGSLITMGNVFTCMFINGRDENTAWALLAILAIGALIGLFNGFGATVLRISPMVMTMATGTIVTGVTLIASHGSPKGQVSSFVRGMGVGSMFGLPMMVWVWFSIAAAVIVMLRFTAFGRKIYYVGANETAAVFSGISAPSVKMTCYALSGVTSIITGAMLASYTETAFLGIGTEYTLSSITAVVIGGTSMSGGKGGCLGTVLGSIILVMIESLLTVMNIQAAGKNIVGGLVILAIITLYYRAEKVRN